jgi:DNA-binding response OmpR family regulator
MSAPKIVVVDDDEYIRALLLVNLERRGYEVKLVEDSRKALETIERFEPELVILDVMMPNVDGWELLKMIKDNPHFDGVKVLMLTARVSPRDRMIGRDILKADEYMNKPFVVGDLLTVLQRMLGNDERTRDQKSG